MSSQAKRRAGVALVVGATLLLVPIVGSAQQRSEPALSDHPAARRLRKRIGALLARSALRGVTLSITVADTATGEEWFRSRPDELLNPASTLKLFTAAAALDRLGPNHRFRTELKISDGAVYLVGDGDPLLTSEGLSALVREAAPALTAAGPVRRVVVDASAFGGGVLPPGYDKKDTDASYRAATGAVALDFGTALVSVSASREGRPPRIAVEPPGSYVIVENRARTVSGKGSTVRIATRPRGDRTVAMITGRIGRGRKSPTVARRRIEHPPLAAAYALAALLRRHGVEVAPDASVGQGTAPEDARGVGARASPPLSEVVLQMNKHSNNFIAEMLLRAIGASVARPGTWKRGRRAVAEWLEKTVGLEPGFRYVNGSGLYDGGRFSTRQVVRLLSHMNGHEHRQTFRDSLAVAGTDGTLAGRLKGAETTQRIIGKTGTLNDVSALSGYARNRSRRLLAFSMVMNDTHRATAQMRAIQDRICALLVESQ